MISENIASKQVMSIAEINEAVGELDLLLIKSDLGEEHKLILKDSLGRIMFATYNLLSPIIKSYPHLNPFNDEQAK